MSPQQSSATMKRNLKPLLVRESFGVENKGICRDTRRTISSMSLTNTSPFDGTGETLDLHLGTLAPVSFQCLFSNEETWIIQSSYPGKADSRTRQRCPSPTRHQLEELITRLLYLFCNDSCIKLEEKGKQMGGNFAAVCHVSCFESLPKFLLRMKENNIIRA